MKQTPDWIIGGDPIRTYWTGGSDLLSGKEVRWETEGKWSEDGEELTLSSGFSKDGQVIATRVQGRLSGTARKLTSESGWCHDPDSEPAFPLQSPRRWNEQWVDFLHGKMTREQLITALGPQPAHANGGPIVFTPAQGSSQDKVDSWERLRRWIPCILGAIVLMQVIGHIAARNSIWLYTKPPKMFDPLTNYISDYAYRSPFWLCFVLSMYLLAAILVWISWRFFHTAHEHAWSGWRRIVSWMVAVLLGYAGLKLWEVAYFPVKPPEVTIEQIQSEMDKPTLKRISDDVYLAWMQMNGNTYNKTSLKRKIEMINSNSQHIVGITPAMMAIIISMGCSIALVPKAWFSPSRRWWTLASLILVIVSIPMFSLFHIYPGLGQRLGFVGVGIWLYLMSRIYSRQHQKSSSNSKPNIHNS